MIKVIDGKRYNTETATLVFFYTNERFCSDFGYRSKKLYLTSKGNWFIHHAGGPRSDMAVSLGNGATAGSEDIEPVYEDDAFGFLQAHSSDPEAVEALDKHFADKIEEA